MAVVQCCKLSSQSMHRLLLRCCKLRIQWQDSSHWSYCQGHPGWITYRSISLNRSIPLCKNFAQGPRRTGYLTPHLCAVQMDEFCKTSVRLVPCSAFCVDSHRLYVTSPPSDIASPDDTENEALLQDAEYRQVFHDHYLLPTVGHRVFVLQPDMKWGEHRNPLTNAELQLAEACTLIETLPQWKVVHKATYSLKSTRKRTLYGKGNFEAITNEIHRCKNVTAVFVNIDMLSSTQLATMQQVWKVPVCDRNTVVLQIFQIRAKTKEAKLQVALAEIPYLRSRARGIHEGTLDRQGGGLHHLGGSGETFWEIRQRLLQEREIKLKTALAALKSKRHMLKKERIRRQIPTIAVVGYTNAGKTSLIKALTGDPSMVPKDQLFATLDVTVHAGKLINHMSVLYVDTVGFISDIPTDLIASFSATLEDMLQADVIVHVYDASHPDQEAQRQNVEQTLACLNLPQSLKDNIVEVANKVDRVSSLEDIPGRQGVSCVTGEGQSDLLGRIQEAVIEATGRVCKKIKVPMSGPMLSWLYKEATVVSTQPSSENSEVLLVDVLMTDVQLAKFQAKFSKKES